MSESELVNTIRMKLSKGSARLFRNNVGVLRDAAGRYVTYGLCVGSSDLIGFKSVIVTPNMVGKRIAQFVAIECKSDEGKTTEAQLAFIDMVIEFGGIAGVARVLDHAKNLLSGVEK